ncbi:MAG: HAD family hydrolase [Chloroflexi bacterium]|nr:HAD family hydrolase [Chloroflexota bacterium]
MSLLTFGHVSFDADLVVFDKDGTLTDFEAMWGRLALAWVERLTPHAGDEALRRKLYRSLGYDRQQQRTLPQGPLVIAPEEQLQTIAASVLYDHGVPWPEAEARAQATFEQTIADLPPTSLVRATGDVVGLLQRLRDAGLRVAVVTTDRRAGTEEILCILGVADLVDHLVCGDNGLPWKPAPDMLLAACERLGVQPSRTAVVGDTVADLEMARQAGAGLKVAVLSGMGGPTLLAAQADVVLRSIDEIGAWYVKRKT